MDQKENDSVVGDLKKEEKDKEKVLPESLEAGSYWLTRILFLRFLGLIYLTAFLVSYHQNKELIGDRGLTPARLYLNKGGDQVVCVRGHISP